VRTHGAIMSWMQRSVSSSFVRLEGCALVVRALTDLTVVYARLRARGFRRLMQSLPPRPDGPDATLSPVVVRRARRYARIIGRASRWHVLPVECLPRSLVLHRWLQREGLPSDLRIGVMKDGEELKAHAWIQLGNHVINDQPGAVQPFTPLTDVVGRRVVSPSVAAFSETALPAASHDR
jgi:hypothetical protein